MEYLSLNSNCDWHRISEPGYRGPRLSRVPRTHRARCGSCARRSSRSASAYLTAADFHVSPSLLPRRTPGDLPATRYRNHVPPTSSPFKIAQPPAHHHHRYYCYYHYHQLIIIIIIIIVIIIVIIITTSSSTRTHDEEAMRYLSLVMYPLVLGYSMYSLAYETHKSWCADSAPFFR